MAARTQADWERSLSSSLDCPVAVQFGRSRTVPVQTRPLTLAGEEGLMIRLHRMFRGAPDDVDDALAKWIRSGRRARRASRRLDEWIHEQLEHEPAPPPRRSVLDPRGDTHDLTELASPLFRGMFARDFGEHRREPELTWGRRGRSRSRRSLRLGSFDLETGIVRIHRVLDQPAVPDWFVRFVLMHEILHAALPPRPGTGDRWVHHGPEFRRRECAYSDYARAIEWEEKNLPRLITCARRGQPLRVRAAKKAPARTPRVVQGELFA